MKFFCPTCERIVPVFNNLQNYNNVQASTSSSGSSRRLLQTNSSVPPAGVVSGTFSVMLVYRVNVSSSGSGGNGTQIPALSLADVQRAVYSPEAATSWDLTVDPASISKYIDSLQNNQFIIGTLQVVQSPVAAQ
jgi:hypothetical protein